MIYGAHLLLNASWFAFGWLFSSRVLGERSNLGNLLLSLSIWLTLMTWSVNLLALTFALDTSFYLATAVAAVSSIALLTRSEGLSARNQFEAKFTLPLLVLVPLAFWYTVNRMSTAPDPDLWIDIPMQGMIFRGQYPPHNPFFPDLSLNGHFARNLTVALCAKLWLVSPVSAHLIITPVTQALLVGVAYVSLLRKGADRPQATLAVSITFLGVGVGGWAGLLDNYFHYTGTAYLVLFTCVYVFDSLLPLRRATTNLVIISFLASLAFFYEILFGLLCATLVSYSLHNRRGSKFGFVTIILLALVLATIQGGPISDLVSRTVSSEKLDLPLGRQNQEQRVQVDFPKSDFGQIDLQEWRYWQVSLGFDLIGLGQHMKTYPGPKLISLFSWSFLRLHWLPLFFLPVSLISASRRRDNPGNFWAIFGLFALLMPFLVSFGPVYDAEYYRWQFAAGVGASISFASYLGSLLPLSGPSFIMAILLALLTCIPGLNSIARQIDHSWTRLMPPGEMAWLNLHRRSLRLNSQDSKFARRFREISKPGQRILTNFSSREPFSILRESVLVGLTGNAVVGHSFPKEGDFAGCPPFRKCALASCFWYSGETVALEAMKVDWIVLDPSEAHNSGLNFRELEGLSAVSLKGYDGPLKLFRFQKAGPTPWQYGRLKLTGYSRMPVAPGEVVQIVVELENLESLPIPAGTPIFATAQLEYSVAESSVLTLREDLPQGQKKRVRFYFVPPSSPGHYQISLTQQDGVPIAGQLTLEVEPGLGQGVEPVSSLRREPLWISLDPDK